MNFRKDFTINDHLQTIEKYNTYNIAVSLVMVHYERAFRSVELTAMLEAMNACRIDTQHINLIIDISIRKPRWMMHLRTISELKNFE